MSNTNWSSKSTNLKLRRVNLQGSVPLIVPDNIIDKIKYACKVISRVEWSGVLFYSVEGSIKDIDSDGFKITIRDIFIMDKGSPGHTDFRWDEDIVEYRMDNPESIDWFTGLIHSHNTMGVFFSGEDDDELNENCTQHNYYLSMIVNNYTDIIAKVAFTGSLLNYTCKDEDGKDYTLSLENDSFSPVMFVYDCKIDRNILEITVPESYKTRLEEISNRPEPTKTYGTVYKSVDDIPPYKLGETQGLDKYNKPGKNKDRNKDKELSRFPDYTPKNRTLEDEWTDYNQTFGGQGLESLAEEGEESVDLESYNLPKSIEEEFAIIVLRLGTELYGDTIGDALDDIEGSGYSGESLAAAIVNVYGSLYENFFVKIKKYHGDGPFEDVMVKLVEIYEIYESSYPFLTPIIAAIKEMGHRLENYNKNKQQNETTS